jgi:hypothetical protein
MGIYDAKIAYYQDRLDQLQGALEDFLVRPARLSEVQWLRLVESRQIRIETNRMVLSSYLLLARSTLLEGSVTSDSVGHVSQIASAPENVKTRARAQAEIKSPEHYARMWDDLRKEGVTLSLSPLMLKH